jgi:hypothetical protein
MFELQKGAGSYFARPFFIFESKKDTAKKIDKKISYSVLIL